MNRPVTNSDVRLESGPSAPQQRDRADLEAASQDPAAPLPAVPQSPPDAAPKPGFKLGRIPPERAHPKEGSDPDNGLPNKPNQESTKEK